MMPKIDPNGWGIQARLAVTSADVVQTSHKTQAFLPLSNGGGCFPGNGQLLDAETRQLALYGKRPGRKSGMMRKVQSGAS
jgi:hypothetical protein